MSAGAPTPSPGAPGGGPAGPGAQVRTWLTEHRGATAVVAGLAAASLLLWGGLAVVASDPSDRPGRADRDTVAGGADDGASTDTSDTDDADTAPDGDADGADDGTDADERGEGADDDAEDADADDEDADAEDADDEDDEDTPGPSPDDHEPLDPSRGDERFIVVVASYASGPSAQRDAEAWAEREGHEPQLLWSSHYPALQPDLWVVFEGPYPDRDAARAAADRLGGGAYLRDLAADG